MELSPAMVRSVLERHEDWQWCSEYGEPGYSTKANASTPLVVLGYYWCRCGDARFDDLHTFENHHPKVWDQMAEQGVEFEWCDEWVIDYDADKCYRVSGDSYSWQSVIRVTEQGELLTPDVDLETWLHEGEYINNPRAGLPSRVFSSGDLEAIRFASYNGTYESGWHPGQTDDPQVITREIREAMGDEVEIVFLLDEASQFYIGFSTWVRESDEESDQ